MNNLRNVAIIAHVDHGKTTLVDQLFQQSGTFQEHQSVSERVMDSLDLEKERGITISAKNASLKYGDYKINIVDTPGHADFGGEVERTLMMVDGAILLVDAAEGPLPQTRFVLQKALKRDLKVILVINKVDRKDARIEEVEEMINDLFLDLSSKDDHLEFKTLYASGRDGWCSKTLGEKGENLKPLFETIVSEIPPPSVNVDGPLQVLVNNLSYSNYLGRLAIGRIERGVLKENQSLAVLSEKQDIPAKAIKIMQYDGLEMSETKDAQAGDIVVVATGIEDIFIGDTISDPEVKEPLERITVDPPTVSVEISVNTSPFAGKEGSYLTSRRLLELLKREERLNVAIKIEETSSPEVFLLNARGELQVSIVIENLRRSGGECMLGRPKVIQKKDGDKVLEPVEHLVIDLLDESVGVITETLSKRRGRLVNMHAYGNGRTRIEFHIPTRGLLGFRNLFLTQTKGEGLMSSYFHAWQELDKTLPKRQNGAIIADRVGVSTEYALCNLEDRGVLFIGSGVDVYKGMIIGEHNRQQDLDVNAVREKKLTNMRAAGSDESTKISPPRAMGLEAALDWIEDDEWIEVTPKNIRIRKKVF